MTLRQFRGKGFVTLGANFSSDAIYAVDKRNRLYQLREELPVSTIVGAGVEKDVTAAGTGGWFYAPRWLSELRMNPITAVVVGGHHSLALAADGDMFSWGRNPHGELGLSAPLTMDRTQEAVNLSQMASEEIVQMSAGAYHNAAVTKFGKVFCWGCNTSNELGCDNVKGAPATDAFYSAPNKVEALWGHPAHSNLPPPYRFGRGLDEGRRYITNIACGASHTVAIDSLGRLLSWGCADGSRLGWDWHKDPNHHSPGAPIGEVAGLENFLAIGLACGAWQNVVLLRRRQMPIPNKVEGRQHAALEAMDRLSRHSTPETRVSPTVGDSGVNGNGQVASFNMRLGTQRSGLRVQPDTDGLENGEGFVFTWGSGMAGQLGLGDKVTCSRPRQVLYQDRPLVAVKVKAGSFLTAVSTSDDEVICWGSKGAGMFMPTPRKVDLPKGSRAGKLIDMACSRDTLVFATSGVGPEYFENLVESKLRKWKASQLAEANAYLEKTHSLRTEIEVASAILLQCVARGMIARTRVASISMSIFRSVWDQGRVYTNLEGRERPGLRFRPRFFGLWGLEPSPMHFDIAAVQVQSAFRIYLARKEARRLVGEIFERHFDPAHDNCFYFDLRSMSSSWEPPWGMFFRDLPLSPDDLDIMQRTRRRRKREQQQGHLRKELDHAFEVQRNQTDADNPAAEVAAETADVAVALEDEEDSDSDLELEAEGDENEGVVSVLSALH